MGYKIDELKALVASISADQEKAYGPKGNKAAGVRLRKAMLEIGKLTKEVRQEISGLKAS